MGDPTYSYATHLNIKFDPLKLIDVRSAPLPRYSMRVACAPPAAVSGQRLKFGTSSAGVA